GLIGHALEQALAEDVVDLVRGEIHRRDAAFLPAQLGARVFEGTVNQPGAGVIGGSKVRDHNADVALLAGSRDEVGKGTGGDVGNRAIPHFLCVEVVEIRGHLIEQNEDGLTAVKKLQPVLFVRGLGAAGPEGFKWLASAKLVGNLAPEEV